MHFYKLRFFKLRLILQRGGQAREPGEKPSKHGRDQLQQLYSHEFPVFLRIGTGLYPGGHPSYNPCPIGLNLEFSGERQKGNTLTASSTRAPLIPVQYNLQYKSLSSYPFCEESKITNATYIGKRCVKTSFCGGAFFL